MSYLRHRGDLAEALRDLDGGPRRAVLVSMPSKSMVFRTGATEVRGVALRNAIGMPPSVLVLSR